MCFSSDTLRQRGVECASVVMFLRGSGSLLADWHRYLWGEYPCDATGGLVWQAVMIVWAGHFGEGEAPDVSIVIEEWKTSGHGASLLSGPSAGSDSCSVPWGVGMHRT